MKYYSEHTGLVYDSVKELEADEKKLVESKKAEEEKQKAIDEAYEEAIKACEKFFELVGEKGGFIDMAKLNKKEKAAPKVETVSLEEFLKDFFS